jgi:hypothetical protein
MFHHFGWEVSQINYTLMKKFLGQLSGDSHTWTDVSSRDTNFSINTNGPGLPWRAPSTNPTNLELAQLSQYHESLFEVVWV